jgi:hypothetical protein
MATPGAIYPVKMPWPAILADIYAAGCTRYRVARILGVGESTVEGWEGNSDPRHAMGMSLLALHEILCPNTPEKRCMKPEIHA